LEIAEKLPKSREGRNTQGKHIIAKGAFGRIWDKYAVPTGLENLFFGLFRYRYFVPNGTEPGFKLFLKNSVLKPEIQNTLLLKSKGGFWKNP